MSDNVSPGLLVGLGVAIGLFLFSRTDAGVQVIASALDAVGSDVRGIRNNNPGNVRRDSTAWQGLAPEQTDPEFFQFVSMDYGVRAIAKILLTYSGSYGLDTVSEIIGRWAPSNENDTGSYINAVSLSLGVSPDDVLMVNDPTTLFALSRAIISQENGAGSFLVSDDTINNGIALALNS